jgi:hypothetical protein
MSVAAGLVIVLMIMKALDQPPLPIEKADELSEPSTVSGETETVPRCILCVCPKCEEADRYYPSYREMVPAMPKDVSKYKTQMCRNYNPAVPLSCKFGARCIFAHSTAELRTPPQSAEDACTTIRELRVTPRARQPTRKLPINELLLNGPDASFAKSSRVAAGPDESGGFDQSHAIGRLTLMRLKALHAQ